MLQLYCILSVCEKCEQVLSYHVASNEEVTLIISSTTEEGSSSDFHKKKYHHHQLWCWCVAQLSNPKKSFQKLIYGNVVGKKNSLRIFSGVFLQPGVPKLRETKQC